MPNLRRKAISPKARTWTAWLLLAVFVPLAGTTAGLWRAQVKRQNDQAFSAQAGSIGASVTTAVRRMDDLTLAARTLLGSRPEMTDAEFKRWYHSMDVDQRFAGVAGFSYVELVRERRTDVYPAGERPYYCLPKLSVAGPGMAETLDELTVPGLDLCQLTKLLGETRDSGEFSAFVVTSSHGHEMFEVIAPVYAGGGVPRSLDARRESATGWIIGLFDAEPILASAVSRQGGVAVSLEREHAAVPEYRIPTGAGAAFRTLSETMHSASVARFGRPARGDRVTQRMSVEADGRWTVTITGAEPTGIGDPEVQATVCLLVWLALGLLAFVLMQVLARGRARALKMVEEKTGQLRHQALHDALTGLPNRALIMDRTEQMLRKARHAGTEVSAMFIDLDGFKGVNDTFGHPAGDELLCVVAARISSVLRETDTIGRLGGDEFVVLVEGGAEKIAGRIVRVLQEPFDLGTGSPITITTSIGIATGDRDAAKDLLRDADIALYEAKGAGRNRYAEFRHEMHIAAHERLELESDLRSALARSELFLVYQPIISFQTGEVPAAEALLRWQHPTRGLIPPAEFIALAEESGVIVDIGAWVLETACEQAAQWLDAGTPIRISVNVSARQLDDPGLTRTVASALRRSGLDPDLLSLEITETALMRDAESAAATLRELRASGVRIAIDDFGTGYSSLAYLQQFPVNALKIDRTFISACDTHDPLIATLVQLGRSLGLVTIAEGVEDETQLERLRELGCDHGQGYLFAPPLEVAALERLLAEHSPAFA
ncbi:EAL domain-containing protein [Solirubrobacter sp. CPCC 204708]|uniref:EAL domain-containing protein n=1 Tax=Solirubrobacter deserti TaxID=2282478 RepID=A0ABT4RV17_9ACTN|nr:EAL domain-containing protein [Solirubrobacter deserti]MBE2320667.1 EAL domain-containing protein [Solirubrobacter deserti]MDA0142428.1 EAL domain-containing protein [Solirubrobacter deserti]